MGTTKEMVDERLQLEADISKMLYAFQDKWECGLEIQDHYMRLSSNRFNQFAYLHLEIKK